MIPKVLIGVFLHDMELGSGDYQFLGHTT